MPTIRLPYPHIGLQTVRSQQKRFNWLSAGRRWRKTTLGVAIAVEGAINGQRRLWGAPTYDQVRIAWDEARKGAGGVFEFMQTRMTAEFPQSGGAIIFRSLDDPDNARGHTVDGVNLDEVGDIKESAYYEVIRPMLIDTGGDLWGHGTPRGRNWFFREHKAAASRDDSMSWMVPTVGCEIVNGELVRKPHPLENPDIPFAEIQQIFSTTPMDIFRQEILAEFLEGEGVVFRNITACMNAEPQEPKAHKGHPIIMGVDWGKQNDFTALSVGCAKCRVELAIDRFNQIDYAFQRGRLKALAAKWHVTDILAESNAMGVPIIEELQRDNLPVRPFDTTATTKPPLIEHLALVLEREEMQFINDAVWTGELEAYERKVSPVTGRSQYTAPAGMHDDTVMSRALMCHAAVNDRWFIY